jgi:hypothetical protein
MNAEGMGSVLGWIAVPGGRVQPASAGQAGAGAPAAEVAILRVVLVPRLVEQLAGSPLEEWPATVNAATPVVEVRKPDQAASPVASTLRRVARSDTWRGFMSHGMTVRPWHAPAGYDTPTVTPTLDQHGDIATTYRSAALQPGDRAEIRKQLERWRATETPPREPPPPEFEKVDFHRAVSLLREHPYVLRMLGLVLELELDAAALPRSTGEPSGEVRVRWPESPLAVSSPWTAYRYDGAHFLPAPGGDIEDGMVDLDDAAKWEVIIVDVDGAVGQLREAARAVLTPGADADGAQLPTLRSAGLQLARRQREQELAARASRSRSIEPASSFEQRVLRADDLVLGYRIDVRPQDSKAWFSLHARRAEYTIDGQAIGDEPVIREEGHLKPFTAIRTHDEGPAAGPMASPRRLRTDEIVGRWNGWSLSLPRSVVETGRRSTEAVTAAAEDLIPYRFGIRYSLPERSLPELRFGRTYQLRARVVDLAGGGLELDDATANTHPTPETAYVRYEPVPPPEVVLPDGLFVPDPRDPGRMRLDYRPLGPGGTPERLVVRSEPDEEGRFSSAPFVGSAQYPANDRRTFVAPPTTFELAAQHGGLGDGEQGLNRALRTRARDPREALPDPLALGAAVTLLPEPAGLEVEKTDARPWAGAWPDLLAKRIELVPDESGGDIAFHWIPSAPGVDATSDAASATARVTLPPGERVLVELSSTVLQADLAQFAISRLAAAPGADSATTRGRHPLITPARRIELVHAVRRPLSAPAGGLATTRAAGATDAVLLPADPVLGLHTPSTAQLDLSATWDEWTDGPAPTSRSAPLPSVAVTRGADRLLQLRQEFGDTKHRSVTYTATAISRYRDCFAESDGQDLFRIATTFPAVSIKSSARPAPPVIVSTVPAFAWSDAAAGGSGSAPAGGGGVLTRVRGGGRLRIHLGRPWFTTGAGERLAVVLWPGTEDDIPPAVRSLVSWLNRDPIHPTSAPRALAGESVFRGAIDPLDVPLVETGHVVRVLPYPVSFHEGQPFADIDLPGAEVSSYSPFAHLALARFQRESLEGLSLSSVVRTDMVPVLPNRTLEVRTDSGRVHVTLTGGDRAGSRPNRVTALLERSDAVEGAGAPAHLTSLGAGVPPFPAWVRVSGAVVVGQLNSPLPALALPDVPGRLRVVIREVEQLGPSGVGVGGVVDAATELHEHTVYLDVVPLPLG